MIIDYVKTNSVLTFAPQDTMQRLTIYIFVTIRRLTYVLTFYPLVLVEKIFRLFVHRSIGPNFTSTNSAFRDIHMQRLM